MERVNENREKLNLSLGMGGPSRDPSYEQRIQTHFPNQNDDNNGGDGAGDGGVKKEEQEDEEELPLSLGLSMNGKFGVDPATKKLRRSSSVAEFAFSVHNTGNSGGGGGLHAPGAASGSHAPLVRTCSLPVASEEEWLRRKEAQSMRRMEARKKRMGRIKSGKIVKEKENLGENSNGNNKKNMHDSGVKSTNTGINLNGPENVNNNNNNTNTANNNNVVMPSSQGSIGSSQRSSSSGISDPQNQRNEGPAQNAEVRSSASLRSVPVPVEQDHRPPRAAAANNNRDENELLKAALLDMPYVCTRGVRRTEGFLYRYQKGQEVKIVCVCHGLFLSPAEFVKHGGGEDVENPLRHIVVNPNAIL